MKGDSLEVLLERMREQIDNYINNEEEQKEMQRTLSEVWAHFRRMEQSLADKESKLELLGKVRELRDQIKSGGGMPNANVPIHFKPL
jgi:chromosome segregation ATPase